ncbi:MAG: hypothetical protein ACKVQQ_11840 [Burkholderiales bacterium]
MARSAQSIAHLALLKARLTIYLYRHPVPDCIRVVNVIENADSLGDIRLLLDYILDPRHRPAGVAVGRTRNGATAARLIPGAAVAPPQC